MSISNLFTSNPYELQCKSLSIPEESVDVTTIGCIVANITVQLCKIGNMVILTMPEFNFIATDDASLRINIPDHKYWPVANCNTTYNFVYTPILGVQTGGLGRVGVYANGSINFQTDLNTSGMSTGVNYFIGKQSIFWMVS